MKSTKKFISIVLAVMMLMTCVSGMFSVNASTGGTLASYYSTNAGSKVGTQKTITIDGDASDWTDDMLIAQGAAWDVANHWKGGHENCVLDTYALYAAWDNSNLYVGWQMVNTTDTWAREGDGPLSDGGRVLDVPLILALSVDPSSTSMSNKNTSSNPIWGQKMGLKFDTHVDNLLYMSGKPGLGEPSLFKAVDASGNTNYIQGEGCFGFKQNGIEYKMAETNICSNIYGLDYSESTDDVYSDDASWVDYKTFKGSSGTHNTKYDSFYEIKIPLSVLGIDASYIEQTGIGAMLVATRGESALDCIPFDDTMLDNATGDYGNDPSTSHEKDDEDVITSSFARIGNLGDDQPVTQPVTQKPTTEPTTVKPTDAPTTVAPTTEAPAENLTVNAKSNIFSTKTLELAKEAETVTVRYDLNSAMDVVNGQWVLSYDSSKLKLKSENTTIMPNISDGVVNCKDGVVKGNFSSATNLYDFSTSKAFVEATFEVIGTGNTDVNLDVQELSVGYLDNGVLKYKNAVVNSVQQDLSNVAGFTNSSINGSANVAADYVPTTAKPTEAPTTAKPTEAPTTAPVDNTKLTVNATSNFFPAESETYDASEEQISVTFKLESALKLMNAEWKLTYDPTKLSFDQADLANIMPNVSNNVAKESTVGTIKGNFSTLSLADFTTEKDFVTVTFDVIGSGETTVDLYVDTLSVAYKNDNLESVEAYVVDYGQIKDVTSTPGFENSKYTTKTVLSTPTEQPTTEQPTTEQPTTEQPTTDPVGDTLTVNATSNILSPVSKVYNEDDDTLTVSYKLQSTNKLINGNWNLYYDETKLSLDPAKNAGTIMPNIPGVTLNLNLDNRIAGAFTDRSLIDFRTEKDFVTVTFDIIGTGTTEINLDVEILGVAYLDNSFEPVIAYPVDNYQLKDVTNKAGFENQKLSGQIVLDGAAEDYLLGDVNGDGSVNVSDATEIQKYAVGRITFTEAQLLRGDVNKDGFVNISDATDIQKYAVGRLNFPA